MSFPPSDSASLVVVDWPFPCVAAVDFGREGDAGGCLHRVARHKTRNKENQKDNNPFPLFLSFLLCQPRLHFVRLLAKTHFQHNSLPGKLVNTWLRRDVCEWCISHECFCISELSRVERVSIRRIKEDDDIEIWNIDPDTSRHPACVQRGRFCVLYVRV